jgi:hypothetical protein
MTPTDPTPPTPAAMLWTGRILTALIVLLMLFDAVTKVMQNSFVMAGMKEANYPLDKVVAVGASLLVSTLLYAIPRTSVLGAILLTAYLGGAVDENVRMHSPAIIMALVVAVLVWGALWLRSARLRSMIPLAARG